MEESDFNITVVGLGLIGGSYAAALKKLNKNVWGIDLDETTLEKAETMGIIDKGYLDPKIPLNNSDLVIISLYPKDTIDFIRNNMNTIKSDAIITDVAGMKLDIIEQVNSFLREDLDFIGGHPMAGREGKGIDMATDEIFNGANYIFTPIENNKIENVNLLENLAYEIGCGKVIKVKPSEHDNFIAYTSQLPHVLAAAAMNCNDTEIVRSFIGNGFRDFTRIAINNSDLWTELLIENKENVVSIINKFQKEVDEIKEAINNNNNVIIKKKFEEANRKRREIS